MLSLRSAVLALAVVAAPATAFALDVAMETARTHFDSAQDLFDKGDFTNAASEFEAAYAAKPFAAFLFNAAVCYEKLKQYDKAVASVEHYLSDDPKARDKKDVEKRIAALKAEIEREKSTPPPVEGQPPPVPDKATPAVEALPTVSV